METYNLYIEGSWPSKGSSNSQRDFFLLHLLALTWYQSPEQTQLYTELSEWSPPSSKHWKSSSLSSTQETFICRSDQGVIIRDPPQISTTASGDCLLHLPSIGSRLVSPLLKEPSSVSLIKVWSYAAHPRSAPLLLEIATSLVACFFWYL